MSSVDLEFFENKKIELNNTNFFYFEKLFKKELVGGFVQKIQTINTKDFYIRLKIRKDKENKELIIGNGICLISNIKTEAKDKNKGISLFLNSKLGKKQIKDIKQINFEKTIVFEFLNFNLYCEFFSKNNIIFTDKENKILYSLIKEEWKDRKIARNSIYKPAKKISKDIFNYIAKETNLDKNKNMVSNIIKNVNVNPIIVEEYIKQNKINKENFNFEEYKKVISFLKKIYSKTLFEKTKYYIKQNKIYLFNIDVPFLKTIPCDLNCILEKVILKKAVFSKRNEILKTRNKEKNNLKHIIDNQEKAKQKILKKAENSKAIGDLIYKNYVFFEKLRKEIEILFKKNATDKEINEIINKYNEEFKTDFRFKKIDKKRQKIVFLK